MEEPHSRLHNPYVSGTLMALLLLASILLPRFVSPAAPGRSLGLCAPPGIRVDAWLANSTVYINITNTGNTTIVVLLAAAGNTSMDMGVGLPVEPGSSATLSLDAGPAAGPVAVRVRYRVGGCTYTSYAAAAASPPR